VFDELTRALHRDIAKTQPLEIVSLIESKVGFDVKLALSTATEKSIFKLKECMTRKNRFEGLYCDDALMEIPLSLPTEAEKVQVHRKSGFILLKLKKRDLDFPCPKISIAGLTKAKQIPFTAIKGMFSLEEGEANRKQIVLSGLAKQKFDMKENLHIVFVRANEGDPLLALQVDGETVGVIYYHAIVKYVPVDITHDWTHLLDCSYLLFEGDEQLSRRALSKVKECQSLALDGSEFEQFKEVLNYFERMTVYKTPHSSAEGISPKFKRIVVTPLYDYVIAPLMDEGSKTRKAMKQMKNMQSDFMDRARREGPAAMFKLLTELQDKTPEELEKIPGFDQLRI
jgi:hypothetical protein